MNGSFSIPPLVNGSLIAVLALAVLIFFVFAMVLYLRRCISTVSQQYQDAADLSSAVTMVNFHSKCKMLGGVAEFFSEAFLCRFPPEDLPRPVVYPVHSLPV